MVVGSSSAMLADSACQRESNSLVLEWALGSSEVTITSPPLTPCWAPQCRESAVQRSPFCFTMHSALAPASDAPTHASSAQTSLVDHSA